MKRLRSLLVFLCLTVAAPAAAQLPPGMGPGGPQPTPRPEEEKGEGPAEAAPPTTQEAPLLQAVPPYPGQAERELQFLELHGYFRHRVDYFYNFNLGFASNQIPPFQTPLCTRPLAGNTLPAPNSINPPICDGAGLSDTNIRFRLEPTLNVSEDVRIIAQIDMFDNLILGSTPESYASGQLSPGNAPLGAFSTTNVPPISGRNSFYDSIMVKRAYGEVRLPVGLLRFGRMPSQWGLGLLANDGSCRDCDFGSNADRILFATELFGHKAAVGYGWVDTNLTTMQTSTWLNRYQGQGFNLDRKWGVSEWLFVVGRIDKPEAWNETVRRGDLAINYGTYQVLRSQENDLRYNSTDAAALGVPDNSASGGLRDIYVKRNAFAWIPDVWFKLTWRQLDLEFEGLYIYGNIDDASDISPRLDHGLRIRQWGGVLRSRYRFLADALKLGLEIGTASGDPTENNNNFLDYRVEFNPPVLGENINGRFHFNPDFHVDEILWRRIYGTVSNATYFKPWISYDIVEGFGARLDLIYSLANVPVATPGNSLNYGLELDVNLGYFNATEGFFAAVTYGVLFPFAALDHPASKDGQSFWGDTFGGSATTAQVLRTWLGIKF